MYKEIPIRVFYDTVSPQSVTLTQQEHPDLRDFRGEQMVVIPPKERRQILSPDTSFKEVYLMPSGGFSSCISSKSEVAMSEGVLGLLFKAGEVRNFGLLLKPALEFDEGWFRLLSWLPEVEKKALEARLRLFLCGPNSFFNAFFFRDEGLSLRSQEYSVVFGLTKEGVLLNKELLPFDEDKISGEWQERRGFRYRMNVGNPSPWYYFEWVFAVMKLEGRKLSLRPSLIDLVGGLRFNSVFVSEMTQEFRRLISGLNSLSHLTPARIRQVFSPYMRFALREDR